MVIGAPEHVWLQHNPRIPRQSGPGVTRDISSCSWLVLPYDPDFRAAWLNSWVNELSQTISFFDFQDLVPRISWASGYRNVVATVSSSYFRTAREG